MIKMHPKHKEDVYGWAAHTAELLMNRKISEVDFDNTIDINNEFYPE